MYNSKKLKGENGKRLFAKVRSFRYIPGYLACMGGKNAKEEGLTQPQLTGLEAEQPEEIELANCLVLALPVYKDTGKRREWSCTLHAQASIFQPDIDMELFASASNELATLSQRKSLKAGDRVVLTGILREDTLTFPTGESKTIHRLTLTHAPEMIAKDKRVSTTVYEQQKRGKLAGK
jgi:hypothetical protein